MKIGLHWRERIRAIAVELEDEFDRLIAPLQAWSTKEHRSDGTHGAVTATSLIVPAVANGTGAATGAYVYAGRNLSGNGAAATLRLEDKNGTPYYLWIDATGVVRVGTSPPTENGSVSDTSGTVIGTQT